MPKTTKETKFDAMNPSEMNCSTHSGPPAGLALLIVLCTIANIGANWYISKNPTTTTSAIANSESSGTQEIVTAINDLRQVQYDQAGGEEMYKLYMQLQQLQAQKQKPQIEAQIASLKGGAAAPTTATAPTADQTVTDEQYASIMKDVYKEGKADAKITVVEYSDLECPYCIMQRKNGTIQKLVAKYGDSINVIYKPLKLANHPGSDEKGMSALCVAKLGGVAKYAKYYGTILDESEVQGPVYAMDKLSSLAKSVGVDLKKFNDCVSNKDTQALYKSYATEASTMKVTGTPSTLILNNQSKKYQLIVGAADISNFESAVDGLLK